MGNVASDFNDLGREVAVRQLANEQLPGPVIVDIADFLSREIPPREMLLAPWLPAQGLCMLHAGRGIGKTYVALSVAYALASGGKCLGWTAERPRSVLFVDGEMPAVALQERLSAIIASADREPAKPLRIYTPDLQPQDRPSLNLTDMTDQVVLEPILGGVDLIVLDNISTLCRGGKENEAESWLPIQGWALRQRAAGRSVLFVHHAGKGGLQRGTSRREDVLDTVITLKRPSDYEPDQGARFEVHFEKTRGFYGDDAKPFEAALITDPQGRLVWTVKSLEDSIYDQVIALHHEGLTQQEIAAELGRHKSRVSRFIKRAKADGRIHD